MRSYSVPAAAGAIVLTLLLPGCAPADESDGAAAAPSGSAGATAT